MTRYRVRVVVKQVFEIEVEAPDERTALTQAVENLDEKVPTDSSIKESRIIEEISH
jgi:hypothetical protein